MTIVERRSHRTIEEDLVIGFSLSCAADRTAALSGPFKVATVAGDAALLKRCRHRSPGRAGEGADTGGGTAGDAGGDRRRLEEEDRSQENVDREQDRSDRHVGSAFGGCQCSRAEIGNEGSDGDDHRHQRDAGTDVG